MAVCDTAHMTIYGKTLVIRHTAPPRIHYEAIQSELWKRNTQNGGEHTHTIHTQRVWLMERGKQQEEYRTQWHHNGTQWHSMAGGNTSHITMTMTIYGETLGIRHTAPPRIHYEAIQSELWKRNTQNGGEHTQLTHNGCERGKSTISSPVKSNDVQWLSVNAHGSIAKDEAHCLVL